VFEASEVQYSHNWSRWPLGQMEMLSTENTENTERKLAVGNSVRQGELALLEEAADGGVAFEADGDLVGLAGFFVRTGLS